MLTLLSCYRISRLLDPRRGVQVGDLRVYLCSGAPAMVSECSLGGKEKCRMPMVGEIFSS